MATLTISSYAHCHKYGGGQSADGHEHSEFEIRFWWTTFRMSGIFKGVVG